MQPVMRLPRDADTAPLRQALWQQRIGHLIREEEDALVLWLADPRQRHELETVVRRWQQGEPLQAASPAASRKRPTSLAQWVSVLKQLPVTVLMVGLSLVVFGLLGVFGDLLVVTLTIVPISLTGKELVYGSLLDSVTSGQIWRLLSPAFLHFGWTHLIFNLMWVWYFGKQIEMLQGSKMLLLLLVVAGISANLAQYMTGTVLFGGMSGVVYALLGHVWLMSRRVPASGFFVPQMLVVFMLGWMVFTMTDLAGSVGFGNVANEAHLGGLLVGLLSGWYYSSRQLRS